MERWALLGGTLLLLGFSLSFALGPGRRGLESYVLCLGALALSFVFSREHSKEVSTARVPHGGQLPGHDLGKLLGPLGALTQS